jgi:hypothetical protein
MFSQPLLIYDDKCSSCGKFAKTATKLSRGWIRIAGHYYSQEVIDIKKKVFPANYDATKMFWLINKKGAYGARSGLFQVIKEIFVGNFKNILENQFCKKDTDSNFIISCNYHDRESCMSARTTLSRIFNMLKNSDKFTF